MYNIQKKTPYLNWHTIHQNFDQDAAMEFLFQMSQGGYDCSGEDGYINNDDMTAGYYDGGDHVQYRAVSVS